MSAGTRMRSAAITGLGAHRPANRVDNNAIAERLDSSDDWIRERSGIITRGVAADGDGVVEMAVDAGGKALAAAGVVPGDVDLVMVATCTLPGQLPSAAPEVAYRLGAHTAGAFDVGAACAGFTYALAMAADSIRAGSADHILIVGSEHFTPLLDHDDRGSAFLFGDGAGAAVVSVAEQDGIGPAVWAHDGAQAQILTIQGKLAMDGKAIYRWATTAIPDLCRRTCERAGIDLADLKAFVPHQANHRITMSVARSLKLPPSVIVADDITVSGNTSAASVPLALARLVESGQVRRGDPVLLFGFGAGLTAAGQVVRCP